MTPGGLNEQAARMIGQAGAPQAFARALSALLLRFDGGEQPADKNDGNLGG